MHNFRFRLTNAIMLTLVPPALVACLYLYGSATGCSGGDCTGTMMGVLMLGLLAALLSACGLLALVRLGIEAAWNATRQRLMRRAS